MTIDNNIERAYRDAIAAAKNGDYMNAIVGLTKVLDGIRFRCNQESGQSQESHSITLEKVLYKRAGAWMERKEYEIALLDINEALRESPRKSDYYSARARIRRELFQYGLAISDLCIAIEYDPNISDYYFQRSVVYLLDSNPQAALQDIEKAIELASPDDDVMQYYYVQRAKIFFKLKKYENALDDCERVQSSDNPYADVFSVAGETYVELKEFAKAQEMISKLDEMEPESRRYHFFRAKYYFEQNDWKRAKLFCDSYIEFDRRSWEAIQLRGECHFWLSDLNNAEIDCKRAYSIKQNPKSCETLANIYSKRKDIMSSDDWNKKKSQFKE